MIISKKVQRPFIDHVRKSTNNSSVKTKRKNIWYFHVQLLFQSATKSYLKKTKLHFVSRKNTNEQIRRNRYIFYEKKDYFKKWLTTAIFSTNNNTTAMLVSLIHLLSAHLKENQERIRVLLKKKKRKETERNKTSCCRWKKY